MKQWVNWKQQWVDWKQWVDWTDTPPGNLTTNAALELAGIVLTVFFIQKWADRREQRRWLPLMHQTYGLLHDTTDRLVRELYGYQPDERHMTAYDFGVIPLERVALVRSSVRSFLAWVLGSSPNKQNSL
jgi:hypothetical protein